MGLSAARVIEGNGIFALLDFDSRATVVTQASVVRCLLTRFSLKLLYASRPHFMGSYLSAISPYHFFPFQNFQFSNFYDFFPLH